MHDFIAVEPGRWTDPCAVHNFQKLKTFAAKLIEKYNKEEAELFEPLQSYIRQEKDNIPLAKLQQLDSSSSNTIVFFFKLISSLCPINMF